MKFLMFGASLSQDSFNKKLINLASKMVTQLKQEVDLADYSELSMPLYNADIQNHEGFPTEVTQFVTRMQAADGLIIATPEYNFSIPGTLKNIIDWVSRLNPVPWRKQKILLLSASPSLVGGNRGLWATRIPLEACGALVFPDMFSLASAHESFDAGGNLKDAKLQERLQANIQDFINLVEKLK